MYPKTKKKQIDFNDNESFKISKNEQYSQIFNKNIAQTEPNKNKDQEKDKDIIA
jgi:hypothetical protein